MHVCMYIRNLNITRDQECIMIKSLDALVSN